MCFCVYFLHGCCLCGYRCSFVVFHVGSCFFGFVFKLDCFAFLFLGMCCVCFYVLCYRFVDCCYVFELCLLLLSFLLLLLMLPLILFPAVFLYVFQPFVVVRVCVVFV